MTREQVIKLLKEVQSDSDDIKEANSKADRTIRQLILIGIIVILIAALFVPKLKPAPGPLIAGDSWCSAPDKKSFQLQDEHGQVYALEQMHPNQNVFTVWIEGSETNGITNTLTYRMKPFQGYTGPVQITIDGETSEGWMESK